jgi:hypothetical protein
MYSGELRTPGEKNFMSRPELKKVTYDCGLINDICGERMIDFAFNLSKQNMIDELTTTITQKLDFVEFCEAFARLASDSSLPRYNLDVRY